MTGYNTILKIRRIEVECAEMGFRLAFPKYPRTDYGSSLCVMPANDELPLYCRDAELFVGTLEELDVWLRGAKWMQDYYSMLKLVDKKKVKIKEDGVRHDTLVRKLKNEELALKGTT